MRFIEGVVSEKPEKNNAGSHMGPGGSDGVAGRVSSFETKVRQDKLEQDKARLEQELLELSRLVHDYETKIHNNVRENKELAQKNKELEWGYRALLRENQWLKEDLQS